MLYHPLPFFFFKVLHILKKHHKKTLEALVKFLCYSFFALASSIKFYCHFWYLVSRIQIFGTAVTLVTGARLEAAL